MMEDLSLHILDIVENAVVAGATRIVLSVTEDEERDWLSIRVSDNGPGMSRPTLRRALDPFFTTKNKRTGLGLPLLAQAAEQCGGGLTIRTELHKGTRVSARFRYGHIDRPPLTNMRGTLLTLILGHPEVDFIYRHRRAERAFLFRSRGPLRRFDLSRGLPPDAIRAVADALAEGLRRLGRS